MADKKKALETALLQIEKEHGKQYDPTHKGGWRDRRPPLRFT